MSSRDKTSVAKEKGVLQKMNQDTVTKVPSPNNFCKKKKKMDNDLTEVYIKQSDGLNNLALQISQALVAKQNPTLTPAAALDPMLGAIQMALTKVKEANKFHCMLGILQYINDNYVKTVESQE